MSQKLPKNIAIDGPVAAGKTTVGKLVAEKLSYLCLDTGFFYRTVTYLALKKGIDVKNDAETGKIAQFDDIEIKAKEGKTLIYSNGEDITSFLRTPQVDSNVSFPSKNPLVRSALTPRMREFAEKNKVIMLGRDIGTIVLPNADLKIWLDADIETRAKRRSLEQKNKKIVVTEKQVLEDMLKRDKIDSERKVAPMLKSPDAITINTSSMSIEEVVEKVIQLCKKNRS